MLLVFFLLFRGLIILFFGGKIYCIEGLLAKRFSNGFNLLGVILVQAGAVFFVFKMYGLLPLRNYFMNQFLVSLVAFYVLFSSFLSNYFVVVLYVVFLLCLFALGYFVSVLACNLLDLYDKKPLRGYSNLFNRGVGASILFLLMPLGLCVFWEGYSPGHKIIQALCGSRPLSLDFIIPALLFCVLLYLFMRLMFAYYIALDTNCFGLFAIKQSWNVTKNHQAMLFLLHLVATVVMSIVGVGLLMNLFFMPMYIYLYRQLSKA